MPESGRGSSPPVHVRALVEAARIARLATVGPAPHIVPITFAIRGPRLLTAVDHKPKRTTELRRLRNIAADPSVAVLVDHYDEDWTQLWWVRLDGAATVEAATPELIAPLVSKYGQYADLPPPGPVIVATISSWTWWIAS